MSRTRMVIAGVGILVVLGYIGSTGKGAPGASSAPSSSLSADRTQPPSAASSAGAATAAVTSAPSAAATSQFATFGAGDREVGANGVQPGTYRIRAAANGCYWARLSGFSGALSDIIANSNVNGFATVTIAAGDKGFTSARCGTWSADLSAVTSSTTSLTADGAYIVGTDLQPGTWKNDGGSGCYWARVSGFGGGLDNILANANPQGTAVVTIAAGDKGFVTARCGTWTKQ